jgi:hypothetical protein
MSQRIEPPCTDGFENSRLYLDTIDPSDTQELVSPVSAAQICIRPQGPEHFWSFLQPRMGNLEQQIETEKLIEDISHVRLGSALERLQAISADAESFLRGNIQISMGFDQTIKCLTEFLMNVGISHSISADYERDLEAPHFETLEVIVRVDLDDFSKILELWRLVDERVYASLTGIAKDRIIIIFERL